MLKEKIKKLIFDSLEDLQKERAFSSFEISEIALDSPEEKQYGDYSTNVALKLAKILKENPLEIAEKIKNRVLKDKNDFIEKIETATPGFINFFISEEYLQNQVGEILGQKEKFGNLGVGKGKKINIEFISANPTGPLTLGNGRGGFCGDVLTNVLKKAGYEVAREYYLNDRGEQIIKLGHSVLGDGQAVYKGDYIDSLRTKLLGCRTPQFSAEEVGEKAAKTILEKMIKPSVKKMGIKFDVWFSEKSLYQKKEVDKAIEELRKKKLTYEKEGAVWFSSTRFGDDKDRVLIKADGEKTYFASDVAYLKNKFERGFEKLIFFWGADHYGYIQRLKAAAEALGYEREQIDIILMQLVRLMENGKEIRMSKRTGNYITLDELIGEVGLDVSRLFFLARSSNTHLDFDLNLAKEQSQKNPVYYIQYAYARICSIIKNSKLKSKISKLTPLAAERKLELLKELSELALVKKLIQFPEVVEDMVKDYQVQRLSQYALELADAFHRFYEECKVISDDKKLTQARLSLVRAVKIVLENTLDLMGISSPEKM